MQITIELPKDLQDSLAEQAEHLNLSIETLILQSLQERFQPPDPDETPTEVAIEGIRQGLYEAFTGQTIPLSQMWDGIDAD
jgi:predicted transcriptional regulator